MTTNSARRTTLKALVGLGAGAGLGASTSANAVTNEVIKLFLDAIFQGMPGAIYERTEQFLEESAETQKDNAKKLADKLMKAFAMQGDALVEAFKKDNDHRAEVNAQPSADHCQRMAAGQITAAADRAKKSVEKTLSDRFAVDTQNGGGIHDRMRNDPVRKRILAAARGEASLSDLHSDISTGVALLVRPKGLSLDEEELAKLAIAALVGDTHTLLALPEENESSEFMGLMHKRNALAARLSVLSGVLNSLLADRIRFYAPDFFSELSLERGSSKAARQLIGDAAAEYKVSPIESISYQVLREAEEFSQASTADDPNEVSAWRRLSHIEATKHKLTLMLAEQKTQMQLLSAARGAASLEKATEDMQSAYVKAASKV